MNQHSKPSPLSLQEVQNIVFVALMAALITVGAWIAVPTPFFGVPVVLQNYFVYVTGLALSWRLAGGALFLYLAAGAVGLPVFAGFAGGWGQFVGPTGGFLLGYLPAAILMGAVSGVKKPALWRDVAAMLLGTIVIYGMGLAWLKHLFPEKAFWALAVGMSGFLVVDCIKMAASLPAARLLRRMTARPQTEEGQQ
ncbi:MAG: biotin transporter BioY [Desulfatibacillaceae bacterium]|nr:biotin transporter BioY [Desulfatibacillaceae bacterium]